MIFIFYSTRLQLLLLCVVISQSRRTIMGFLSLKKPDDEVGAAWPSIMVGAFAAFAGILYGYDTGTISGE